MMKKYLMMLTILCSLTGCTALPYVPGLSGMILPSAGTQMLTTSSISLSKHNYKIVKANATGKSEGFSFLGLIPVKSPTYTEAITRLYQSAPVTEGKAQALVNTVYEHSSSYFILFSLTKITVRADLIEFTDGTVSGKN